MSFLERLQGFRQGRGKDTPFLDEWMAAGGVGSGFLKDKWNNLGSEIDAGNRPFLGGLRDNSNALLLGGAGMAQGRGGFGPGFAQGAQVDQANADQRRQLAEQEAYQQAVSGLQIPDSIAPIAPYLNPGQLAPVLLPQAPGDREMREDQNGVLRYVDTQEPVFPGVEQVAEPGFRMLSGKEVEALIGQGTALDPTRPYKINLETGELSVLGGPTTGLRVVSDGQGGVTLEQGPGVTGGDLSVNAAAAHVYADRMYAAEQVLAEIENVGTDLGQRILGGLPVVGNFLVSTDYQRYQQAERDFINAVLRRESGAVISDEEFANARQQYFPQPGDNQQVIDQKRRSRQLATDLISLAAGPGFDPAAYLQEGAVSPAIIEQAQPVGPVQFPNAPPVGQGYQEGDIVPHPTDPARAVRLERNAAGELEWVEMQRQGPLP